MRPVLPLLATLFAPLACGDKGMDDGTGDDGGTELDADGDGYGPQVDCDDASAAIHPNAEERCDGIDNDCDGTIDEDSATDAATWYLDEDGDGYGTSDDPASACSAPEGHVAEGGDCDDADAAINPDASEICDGVDNDCDALVDDDDDSLDESTLLVMYPDADSDGFGDQGAEPGSACTLPSGFVTEATDCDDTEASVNPDATEVCDEADVDEDCSGAADDEDASVDASTQTAWYADLDQDGYGAGLPTSLCEDPSTTDDWFTTDSTDCDDTNAAISPSATEICDALDTDEDCDGLSDDEDGSVDTATMSAWVEDSDEDGYGASGTEVDACDDPSTASLTYCEDDTDCDDTDPAVNPGATEICDAADTDEDCDGLADDDDPSVTGTSTWYLDADLDGYGDASSSVEACEDPSTGSEDWTTDNTDCDDDDAEVNPAATETCDGIDNDCDATTTESDEVLYSASGSSWSDVTSTWSAGSSSSPTSITLSAGTYTVCGGPYYVALTTGGATTIEGLGDPVLSGASSDRILRHASSTLSMSGLTLRDGAVGTAVGGAIYVSSSKGVTLEDVSFEDNTASRGGALYISGGITATRVSFDGNSSTGNGGAIYLSSGYLTATDCTFTNNSSASNGGAIYLAGGYTATTPNAFTDTWFEGNSATSYGGAIYMIYQNLTCTRSSATANAGFEQNTATEGGAIYWDSYEAETSIQATSTGCDFGSGTTDNATYDVSVYYSSAVYGNYSYGSNATFTCSRSGC